MRLIQGLVRLLYGGSSPKYPNLCDRVNLPSKTYSQLWRYKSRLKLIGKMVKNGHVPGRLTSNKLHQCVQPLILVLVA